LFRGAKIEAKGERKCQKKSPTIAGDFKWGVL